MTFIKAVYRLIRQKRKKLRSVKAKFTKNYYEEDTIEFDHQPFVSLLNYEDA